MIVPWVLKIPLDCDFLFTTRLDCPSTGLVSKNGHLQTRVRSEINRKGLPINEAGPSRYKKAKQEPKSKVRVCHIIVCMNQDSNSRPVHYYELVDSLYQLGHVWIWVTISDIDEWVNSFLCILKKPNIDVYVIQISSPTSTKKIDQLTWYCRSSPGDEVAPRTLDIGS